MQTDNLRVTIDPIIASIDWKITVLATQKTDTRVDKSVTVDIILISLSCLIIDPYS
jgi:hypothetical protein